MSRQTIPIAWMGLALIACASGCAALARPSTEPATAAETPSQRREQVIAEFEARRDDAQFHAAMNHWQQRDYDRCEENLASILGRTPDHRDAGLLWLSLQHSLGTPEEASETADRLAELHADDEQVTAAVAEWRQTIAAEGEPGAAESSSDDPHNPQDSHATESAEATVARVESRKSEVVRASAAIGSVDADDFADATDEDDVADRVAAQLVQFEDRLVAGQVAEAWDCYLAAQQRAPDDPQVAISASVAALRQQYPELALELTEGAPAAFRQSAALQRIRGRALFQLGRYAEAEVGLRQTLSLDSGSGLTYLLLSQTLAKQGREAEARRHLARAESLDPRLKRLR